MPLFPLWRLSLSVKIKVVRNKEQNDEGCIEAIPKGETRQQVHSLEDDNPEPVGSSSCSHM